MLLKLGLVQVAKLTQRIGEPAAFFLKVSQSVGQAPYFVSDELFGLGLTGLDDRGVLGPCLGALQGSLRAGKLVLKLFGLLFEGISPQLSFLKLALEFPVVFLQLFQLSVQGWNSPL